jgi:hypothetical protein
MFRALHARRESHWDLFWPRGNAPEGTKQPYRCGFGRGYPKEPKAHDQWCPYEDKTPSYWVSGRPV